MPFLITICAIGAAAFVNVACCCFSGITETASDFARDKVSEHLDSSAIEYDLNTQTIRSEFSDLVLNEAQKTSSYHTHPIAAGSRSSASSTISYFARCLGKEAYFYQCSNADLRNGRNGSRTWYWGKDVAVSPSPFNPPPDAILAMVDVDYYVDMPRFLNQNFRPHILYTFSPTRAAGRFGEMAYCFTDKQCVKYTVAGGGKYEHEIWSYGQDFVAVTQKIWGIPYSTACYNIDRRHLGDDHYLVLFTPVKQWKWHHSWITCWLEQPKLERLRPVTPQGFVRMHLMDADGPKISTGRVNEYIEVTVPAADDSAVAITARNSKVGLTPAQANQWVAEKDRQGALMLYEFHKVSAPAPAPVVFPLEHSVRRYQFEPANYDPDAKPAVVPFMAPIIDGCYAPDRTPANERTAIDNRINKLKAKDIPLTPFLAKVMQEFVDLFIPHKHEAHPYDDDHLYAQQKRPSQRRILEEAEFRVPTPKTRKVSSFLKAECYGDPKDPRVISTIDGVDKAAYSKFIYALADHLKRQKWYAFGKSPREVSERIAELCRLARELELTDFNRFDGRLSEILRELEKMVLLAFFAKEYHQEILDLHGSQYCMKGYGAFGTKYESIFARLSGSPETACFNSIVNAFIAYLALRMTRIHSNFNPPTVAWEKLGMYGGDDGVTPDVDPKKYSKAAAMVGMSLDIKTIARGQPGVQFLARIYGPGVWFGDNTSCCDLPRQLAKFHVTVSLPPNVSPTIKLVEKCRAFYLTDRNTPVLGPLTRRVVELADALGMKTTEHQRIWNADVPIEVHYPNAPRVWMDEYADRALSGFNFTMFNSWLDTVETLEDALSPPLCLEPKPVAEVKQPVVVSGELYVPPPLRPSPPRQAKGEKPKRERKEGEKRSGPKKKPEQKKWPNSRVPKRPQGTSPPRSVKEIRCGTCLESGRPKCPH